MPTPPARARASRPSAPVVRAVLGAVAADRHRAPGRRAVLGAVEERVLTLTASLHPRPVAADLRLVQDADQRRRGTVAAAVGGLERRTPVRVDGDGELRAGREGAEAI